MLAMEWTLQFCSKAQYYIASDTDTWINVPYIVRSVLPSFQDTHGKQIFAGYQINNGKPIRNPLSRYYISTTVYPNETFPPYPTGCFYLFSIDALEQFYQLSKTVKPALYFNDVFLGLINQQAHIPFRNYRYPRFRNFLQAFDATIHADVYHALCTLLLAVCIRDTTWYCHQTEL